MFYQAYMKANLNIKLFILAVKTEFLPDDYMRYN